MLNLFDTAKEIKSISDHLVIEESSGGLLVTAHTKLIVPEKTVVLPDSFTDDEKQLVKIMANKKGLIL